MTLFEDLKYRGLIKDISSPELEKKLNGEKLTFYIGTDPTADSMHIGHFSSFLIASRYKGAEQLSKPSLTPFSSAYNRISLYCSILS